MKSIRSFLIIVILSTITLMAFLSALNGYRDSMAKAEQLFDSELIDKAHLLSMAFSANRNSTGQTETMVVNFNGHNIKHKKKQLKKSEQGFVNNGIFAFQIWQNDTLLLRSFDAPETPVSQFKQGFQERNFLNNRWRTYSYYEQTADLWIFTAERMDIRYVLAENIILDTILPVVMMLPLLGILIWYIISYGLSPLRKLATELGNKRADDFSPLAIDKQPVELVQVVNSTNDLLQRLKASFLRERRFASDAAHELRTPISAIKIHLHNLSHSIQSNEHSFQQLESAVNRMGHLVEQILNLNRTSPEQYITRFTPFDLYNLAQEIIVREYSQFQDNKLQIALEGSHCAITGDKFALDVLLQNLLTNACKYTPEGGSVLISINCHNKTVQLQVEDSGPGVPEEHYERLFDRFYRLNGDCHASGTIGCGLGLAIVQQIVELHHASISLGKSSFSSGLQVKVVFPKEGLR